MPRVTPSIHYKRYLFLRTAWLEFPKLYALLPLRQLWQVHEFYQPSKELTKSEFIAHIKQLIWTKPSLVHQAGKHYKLMYNVFRHISKELGISKADWDKASSRAIQHYNPSSVHSDAPYGHTYTLSAVARPEVDVRKLARALVEVAKQMKREANDETRVH